MKKPRSRWAGIVGKQVANQDFLQFFILLELNIKIPYIFIFP